MKIGEKRTPEQVQKDMREERSRRMENATLLAFDLLDHGYHVWLDMYQITSHGEFYCYIVLNEIELDAMRMADVFKIAEAHVANVTLKEIWMNQQKFTRLILWPAKED